MGRAAPRRGERVLAPPTRQRPATMVVIDDIPIFRTPRSAAAPSKFAVLAAFEVFIAEGRRSHRLRLLRAFPRHDGECVPAAPQRTRLRARLVLSDGATGIFQAVRRTPRRGRPRVPTDAVRLPHPQAAATALHHHAQARRVPPGQLDVGENWSFCASNASWETWWAQLEACARAQGMPPSSWNTKCSSSSSPSSTPGCRCSTNLALRPAPAAPFEAVLHNTIKPSASRARGSAPGAPTA